MRALATELEGVLRIEQKAWHDPRGSFVETWNERDFAECGIAATFVQDNLSVSERWVIRGLHYQVQQPQGKLIRVITGEIYDVVVDLRRSSPTFRRSMGLRLSSRNPECLWVPPGFAHGFLALENESRVAYKVTDYWAPAHEQTILWNDSALRIDWPIPAGVCAIVSQKDLSGIPLDSAATYS